MARDIVPTKQQGVKTSWHPLQHPAGDHHFSFPVQEEIQKTHNS